MTTCKIGDKVIIHSKSVGYRLQNILENHKIESVPFFGWIRDIRRDTNVVRDEDVYVIWYTDDRDKIGGDFYLRRDFDMVSEDMFSDEEFEI